MLAGLGIHNPTAGMLESLAKPLCLCGGVRRALEPVRATRGPKELCQLPVGQSLEVQKGLEIRTLPQSVPTVSPRVTPKLSLLGGDAPRAHCRGRALCCCGCCQSSALSSCPSWLFVPGREQSEMNVPDSVTLQPLPPSGCWEGRSCALNLTVCLWQQPAGSALGLPPCRGKPESSGSLQRPCPAHPAPRREQHPWMKPARIFSRGSY